MTTTVSVTLKCPKCGSAPETDEGRRDDAEVRCSNPSCNTTLGTWGEVKKQATKAVADSALKTVRDALRKGGFK
jgi:hypothetical protein